MERRRYSRVAHRTTARAAFGTCRPARIHRPDRFVANRAVFELGRTGGSAKRLARAPRRGIHAEAARIAVSGRASARRLVEVEDRAVFGGLRADLRAARQWPARQPAQR